ncbi:MAG: exosortase C-terminal domain/associated protein EpsI [Planctomycetota bacterium]
MMIPIPAKRLFSIAAVLAVFMGGASFLLNRAKSSEVRPLHKELSDLPYELGDWRGEDKEFNERIEKTVGARHAISRLYRATGPDGTPHQVSLHIGEWNSLETPTLPHPPAICYPATGAEIVGREPVMIGESDPIEAEILTVEHQGMRSLVLYWYQWNEQVCTTRWDACLARLKMIGRRQWPPVVKVMLDTVSISDHNEAKQTLEDLARRIRAETRRL